MKNDRWPWKLVSSTSSIGSAMCVRSPRNVITKVCGLPELTAPEDEVTVTLPLPMLGRACSLVWTSPAVVVESSDPLTAAVVWLSGGRAAGGGPPGLDLRGPPSCAGAV